MNEPPRSRPRTVLYLTASDGPAHDGAAELEDVPSGPDRTVASLSTDELDRLRDWAPDADCVVFAETPTTDAGSNLLEVVDACESTPVVLFTDASYAPRAARATDGIDGYVRRDTDDALEHLADEIEWVCGGERGDESDDDPIAMPGDRSTSDDEPADRLLESLATVTVQRDRDRFFELLVHDVAAAFDTDYCWLSTVHFGEFTLRARTPSVPDDFDGVSRDGPLAEALETGEPILLEDLASDDRLELPFSGDRRSACCVPVGDAGILCVAAEERGVFDERDRDLLAAYGRAAGGTLERIETESQLAGERDRLRREREKLQQRRDQLADDRSELRTQRDRLATQRDRARAVFERLPVPAARYELDDGRAIVRDVTASFVDVFDVEREAILGASPDELVAGSNPDAPEPTLLEAIGRGERRRYTADVETADGLRTFRLLVSPLEAASGRDSEAFGGDEGLIVYRDVTARRRREREVAAAEAQLETIAALIDDEVRRPLNVARGFLELAEETGDEEHFSEVESAQDRLLELVDRLSQTARGGPERAERPARDSDEHEPDRARGENRTGRDPGGELSER
ncbi:GAF domain-containing protein [Natrarchaeobius oligotrophus]|uniref:GAF domain-containing protein n=1 Tax=Natrarchaeobius chitinivorans TaxID=1679083 RepID=A0A3N6MHY7_NATCH|nr:GAF domain-containing protein [Natrarchaeobius chitinivorans]RQH00755.1 GAF domain-containing protein [Natrarchaeobius chitinivorans]